MRRLVPAAFTAATLLLGACAFQSLAGLTGGDDHDGGPDASEADGAALDAASPDAPPDGSSLDAPSGDASTSIRFVQQTATFAQDASTAQIVLPGTVSAHDTLVVGFDVFPAVSLVSTTDTGGDTFQSAVGPFGVDGGSVFVVAALDVAGVATNETITFTFDAPFKLVEMYAHEYANIAAFDESTAANGTTSAPDGMNSGPVTTAASNELVFGFGVTGIAEAGTNFTLRSSFNDNLTEDLLSGSPGSYAATATMRQGNAWAIAVATFKSR